MLREMYGPGWSGNCPFEKGSDVKAGVYQIDSATYVVTRDGAIQQQDINQDVRNVLAG